MDEKDQVETTETETNQSSETPEQIKARLTEAEKRIKELNRESAERRKKLEAYEAAEEQRKQAAMSETEKLTAAQKAAEDRAAKAEQEREAAITRANETLARSMVIVAAKDTFIDPSDAWTFAEKGKLKINEAGEVEGIKEALEAVAKAKPHLLKADAQNQNKSAQTRRPDKPGGNKPATTPTAPPVRL